MTPPPVAVALRRLRWRDIPVVLDLERELFEGDAWSAELFWSELAQHRSRHYVVAVDGERVVGYAGIAVTDDEGYVQTIGVTADAQRRGIGATLMTDLMAAAATHGVTRVGLEVRTDNTPAHALYRRFGFAPVGVRRGYYQPSGADALVMMTERVDAPERAVAT